MATMTTADVVKLNNSEELVGAINEVIKIVPELQFFQASPVTRNSYKTLAVTALPSVGFRVPGTLREYSTATLENKTVECYYLDAGWIADKSIVQASDWGKESCLAIIQQAHLQAAFLKAAEQIWYGDKDTSNGFNGFSEIIDAILDTNSNRTNVIQANIPSSSSGGSISDGSSVYAIRTGIDSSQIAWGSDGKINEGDVVEVLIHSRTEAIASTSSTSGTAASTKGAWHYAQDIAGYMGLQVSSRNACAKIEALSASNGKNGLNDNLLYDLLLKFPAGMKPDGIFMTRRSLSQLRKSRTATSVSGAPAPYPTEFEGIPIYITDALKDNESYTV